MSALVGIPSRRLDFERTLGAASRPAPAWCPAPAAPPSATVAAVRARYAPWGLAACVDAEGRGAVLLGRAAFVRSVPARLRPLVERHQHVHPRFVSARMQPSRGAVPAAPVSISPKPRVLAGARKPIPPAVGLVTETGHRAALALADWALVGETAPGGAWWVDAERAMAWYLVREATTAAVMLLRGAPNIPAETLCTVLEDAA